MSDNVVVTVSKFFREHRLENTSLVVAVSGGPDSVCLLHSLAVRRELGLDIIVAHLNHCLRGAESDSEQSYVKGLADSLGLPCTLGQENVKAYQDEHGLSLEEAARELRYRFLAQVAEAAGTDIVVTGHTRDDQVETILLHIIRGSGPDGLQGLKPLTTIKAGSLDITIVRPLLHIERAQTLDYCTHMGLEPKIDSSNLSLSPLRNRVRLELLPLLASYNPGVKEGLLRLSTLVNTDLEYIERQTRERRAGLIHREGPALVVSRSGFGALHKAIQGRIMRGALQEMAGTLKDVEHRHIDGMLNIMYGAAGRRIDLPYGLVFLAGYGECWLASPDNLPCPYPVLENEYELIVPGVTTAPGFRVTATFVDVRPFEDYPHTAYLDGDVTGTGLRLRAWQAGDRFQPLGLAAEKKVARYLLDARLPRYWRAGIPLVVSAGRVAWLVGQRIDDRFKVTENTRKILKLEYIPA